MVVEKAENFQTNYQYLPKSIRKVLEVCMNHLKYLGVLIFRNLSEAGFERFRTIYRVATPISDRYINTPVEFYSNVTGFWHEVIPAIEQLHIVPQYRVLLQPCTMCQYPYKIPFYIILTILVSFASSHQFSSHFYISVHTYPYLSLSSCTNLMRQLCY